MGDLTTFKIDVAEPFEHLPRAPIVEAVIDIRARATFAWNESYVRSFVESKIPDYRYLDSQQEFQAEINVAPGGRPDQMLRDLGLKGVRFRSSDQKYIAQFNRDGFVLSRLEPYTKWVELSNEANRLRLVFQGLANPTGVLRLGLRFINRIMLPVGELRFEEYIVQAPKLPYNLELPFHGFMHQDILAAPGYPYAIKLIRTILPSTVHQRGGLSIILDIDVFTVPDSVLSEDKLHDQLEEMRWLKNKVFFGSVTEKALEIFR